ncbi:heavy-metal-associated domain-containing protein [Yeosuana sp.]|uniref:heavy-metal-associated domain-containing protein n=1 Tax=Yeosuana sp. TaxID=2529388 RepID=UPI0040550098
MNTLKNIIAIFVLVLFSFSCKNEAKPEIKTAGIENEPQAISKVDENATFAKAEFTIDGMTCAIGCAKTIEKKIAGMEGVKSATVDFDRKLAMVEYNKAKVTPASLEETVTKVATIYKVSNMKTVDAFTTQTLCNKECCDGKTDAEKANCKKEYDAKNMDSNKKTACAPDCKKSCCAEKNKA